MFVTFMFGNQKLRQYSFDSSNGGWVKFSNMYAHSASYLLFVTIKRVLKVLKQPQTQNEHPKSCSVLGCCNCFIWYLLVMN